MKETVPNKNVRRYLQGKDYLQSIKHVQLYSGVKQEKDGGPDSLLSQKKNATAYLKLEEKLPAYLLWLQKKKKNLIMLGNAVAKGLIVVLLKFKFPTAYYLLRFSQIRVWDAQKSQKPIHRVIAETYPLKTLNILLWLPSSQLLFKVLMEILLCDDSWKFTYCVFFSLLINDDLPTRAESTTSLKRGILKFKRTHSVSEQDSEFRNSFTKSLSLQYVTL